LNSFPFPSNIAPITNAVYLAMARLFLGERVSKIDIKAPRKGLQAEQNVEIFDSSEKFCH